MNIIEKIVHPHICISTKREKFKKNSTELFRKDVQPKTNKNSYLGNMEFYNRENSKNSPQQIKEQVTNNSSS